MKKLILFLTLFIPFLSQAQAEDIDSTKINDTLVLKREYVSYIKASLGDQGGTAFVRFLYQVAEQIDTANYNPDQLITVISPAYFTKWCYIAISNQPFRTSNRIIPLIKEALVPQIKNMWLLRELFREGYLDEVELQSKIQAGERYWKEIK